MIARRRFLGSILAAAAAPAIVRSESLMRIIVPKQDIILPSFYDERRPFGMDDEPDIGFFDRGPAPEIGPMLVLLDANGRELSRMPMQLQAPINPNPTVLEWRAGTVVIDGFALGAKLTSSPR